MTTPKTKTSIVLASGGLDSTVALTEQINTGRNVVALTINYGQRHTAELTAIEKIVHWYQERGVNLQHKTIDLSNLGTVLESVLTRPNLTVPEGHYAKPTMAATVVPNRNMILISVAAGYAESIGAQTVVIGCHSGDHPIYPDCRPRFIAKAYECVFAATDDKVSLYAPYVGSTKADIVFIGLMSGAPLHHTWSCYQTPDGTGRHCGVCGTCNERKEAFRMAATRMNLHGDTTFDFTDPTDYVS